MDDFSKVEEGAIASDQSSVRDEYVVECVDVNVHIAGKHILKNINATFLPGTLTALMGPSGAGKTTLLNALSDHGSGQSLTGTLTLNSKPMTPKIIRALSNLTPQLDVLIAVLTPRECFNYAAHLALNMPDAERQKRVKEVLEDLSLQHCADVIIGNEDIKGLSGGERKRCSMGLDLLTDPKIMYLDEPTSGLDSKVAADVVKLLRKLAAKKSKTIICTIHQPSFQVFNNFDYLVLLNHGEVVFNGQVQNVAPYFESLGLPVPEYTNPADHMLLVLSEDVPKGYSSFTEAFEKSTYGDDYKLFQANAAETAKKLKSGTSLDLSLGTSWFNQFNVLFRRAAYITFRDKRQLKVRLLQNLFIALLLGSLYFDLANKQSTRFDRQSALFNMVLFSLMGSIMGTIITLPIEKAVVKREYGNGNFSVSSFYIARTLVLYSYQTAYMVLFTGVIYPMIGLQEGIEHYFTFLGLFLVLGNLAISIGYLFGTLFPNVTSATAIVPMLIIPLVFFSGLFITYENIPIYFVWMYYLSFVQYAYQILVVNEFRDRNFEPCSALELQTPGDCPLGPCNADPFNQTLPPESCSGRLIVALLDYELDMQQINWIVLAGYWIAVFILGAVVLDRFLKQ